jgi:bifunctional pyridoxal-dependent enzyme with beta-cystathionase and maltose regulon repressor activities
MTDLLPDEPLHRLRARRSTKWRAHSPEVLPLSIAEMDFALPDAVREALADAVERSDTGYLAWLDCHSLGSGTEPSDRFLAAGVALEDGLRFGEPSGYVRLNFGTSTEVLELAVDRMASALRQGTGPSPWASLD